MQDVRRAPAAYADSVVVSFIFPNETIDFSHHREFTRIPSISIIFPSDPATPTYSFLWLLVQPTAL